MPLVGRSLLTCLLLLAASSVLAQEEQTSVNYLEEITIIGTRDDVAKTAGSAHVIDALELEKFEYADIQSILRNVPGVSIQLEDGYGLRPNLSIRGTATERSGRITLLEDNVLIAPAPYSAPSAYYFPTAGRMDQVEVLKGSSSVRQGPYTVGGAINFVSTPIPDSRTGMLNLETGSDHTRRIHAHYGDNQKNYGWLLETHLWDSEGFQSIDLVGGDTGLDKDDWTAKIRINSDPGSPVYHQLDLKLQYATEDSDQSYLGLTDADFYADPYRRYAASQMDHISTEHEQIIVRYLADIHDTYRFTATLYNNNHQRDWFKTEGLDSDGSNTAADFSRVSWYDAVQAANRGEGVGSLNAGQLQALLDGGNSASGALQMRSNAREYFSRGLQLGLEWQRSIGNSVHDFEFGARYHEDEEDRLQRNSTYTLLNGELVLDDPGLPGNAGNRIQDAKAASFHIYDRVSMGDWVVTPGLRYENIRQKRTRYLTSADQTNDPASRDETNLRDQRDNHTKVLIPGIGVLYSLNDDLVFFGGVHKGFTAPSNSPGVNEEKSINFEAGLRFQADNFALDAAAFLTDYDNILGECTSSSGTDCEIGEAFNGDAASITGLEIQANYDLSRSSHFSLPIALSYTWLNGEFQSNIADTDFFGDVKKGDRLPYIPENQILLSAGLERPTWSAYVRTNYVDEVCARASCSEYESTDDFLVVDLSAHYQISDRVSLYSTINNLTQESAIVGRQPYGARPVKERGYSVGVRIGL